MSKNRTPQEWAVWNSFKLALGRNWARKNTKQVRRDYARLWSVLTTDERRLVRACGWHRPGWVAEERARNRKTRRRERKLEKKA